jgi:hypothetical protein
MFLEIIKKKIKIYFNNENYIIKKKFHGIFKNKN